MNNWLKLALLAFVGILVSSIALGAVAYVNGTNNNIGSMNMGNMNMGSTNQVTTNPSAPNMGSNNVPYGGYGMQPWAANGNNPMPYRGIEQMNRMRNWRGYSGYYYNPYGTNMGQNQNMNMGQNQNMNMGQNQNMNMGQNQNMNQDQMNMNSGQMNMNQGQMSNMNQGQMPMM